MQLVILPGLMCDARMFAAQRAQWADCAVVDRFYPGCATITQMALHVLERLPARAVVLGHSMGARVAIELWRLASERIAGMVIADAGVHAVRPGEREARLALRDLGREQGMAALVEAWLPPMLAPANRHGALIGELAAMCAAAGIGTYERQIGALLTRPEAEAVLPAITCPVLVMAGDQDSWSPAEQHREIADMLPDSELAIIPGAGHMMPAEAPSACNTVLGRWLDRLSATAH